ncbi:tetratricopeptide repeat protein [Desulfohalobiaceae bacterium Ax17]|uniref:tetratricopeptide repeat protein n=1 Tax=Desulfovulcanus ferrireducens TaxID=2831190 RepID=UPI0025A31F05|nr:tetratricopeptide repeat protein [Desulfovulcanus ferrireducens]MBT8763685.1 tetratricopeptide repeat protein [Desulfovulcanus ferrireducens]
MLDKGKPVLVADDIQPARETMVNILRVLGFKNIVQAANGEEAWELLQDNPDVELIISDWKMPRMDGVEFLRKLRRDSRWQDVPFLFVTSKSEREDVALASDLGISGYLVKPVTIGSFIEKLKKLDQDSSQNVWKEAFKGARRLGGEGKFDEAEHKLRELIEEFPALEPRIYLEIAHLYAQKENWYEAEKMAANALTVNPLMVRAWFFKAQMQGKQKRWEEAIETAKQALEISPKNTEYILFIGEAYLNINDLTKAREYFIMAINNDPKDNELKEIIWNTYLKYDLVQEVQADFGPLLFTSLTVDTLNNFALALRRQGSPQDALDVYKLALKKEPENQKILYNISVAYLNVNRTDSAIKYLQKAVQINPEFHQAQELLDKLSS